MLSKFALLSFFVFLTACNSQRESVITANADWREAEAYSHGAKPSTPEQKEKFSRSIEEKLKTLSAEIEELKARTAMVNGEVKNNLTAAFNTLKMRAKNLENQLDDLRRAAADQWELMREEMQAAMKDLEEASLYFAGLVPA